MDYKKLIYISFIPFFLFANENWNSGLSEAGSLLGIYKGDLDNRVVKPMTTDTPLKTTDNSKTGIVTMSCGSEKPFIKIGYSGTSDISISIQGDLNFDSSYEKSWRVSGVSGVCSNGFIKCDTDTWSNCHYYKWSFDTDLRYSEVEASTLGGCYCINSSCHSLASSNKIEILNNLAGAIGNVLNTTNNYLISRTENDGIYSYLWGQSANCRGETIPTNINEDNINSKTEEVMMSDLDDENSTYYILNKGVNNVNEHNESIDDDFKTQLKDRSITAQESANYDKDSKNYSYDDKIDGTTINVDGSIQVGDVNKSKFCEVEWIETDTASFSDDTTRTTSTTDDNVKKTEIRECNNTGTVWICPIDISKGETVKHDCGEINDFAEVTSGLAAINEAVKDFTCSGE